MFKRLERHILPIPQTTRPPACNGLDREHATVFLVVPGRQQQVLILLAVESYGQRIVLEQVCDWRAVKLHVIEGRTQALQGAFANIEAQRHPPHLLDAFFGQGLEQVETLDIDEQKLVLKSEVLLQVSIAAEGIQRVWHQGFIFSKAHRSYTFVRQLKCHW
ncbi:hypothetical protein D3C87_1330860 [compost metagenome]